jgi:hypothetical protein
MEEVMSFCLYLLFAINHCITDFCDSFIMSANIAIGVAIAKGDSVGRLASCAFLSRCTVRVCRGVYMYVGGLFCF